LSKLKKSPVTARFPDPFLLIWTMWSSKSKYYPLTVCSEGACQWNCKESNV
jgi:hypothetical protein